jgi:hypothetical protein
VRVVGGELDPLRRSLGGQWGRSGDFRIELGVTDRIAWGVTAIRNSQNGIEAGGAFGSTAKWRTAERLSNIRLRQISTDLLP